MVVPVVGQNIKNHSAELLLDLIKSISEVQGRPHQFSIVEIVVPEVEMAHRTVAVNVNALVRIFRAAVIAFHRIVKNALCILDKPDPLYGNSGIGSHGGVGG